MTRRTDSAVAMRAHRIRIAKSTSHSARSILRNRTACYQQVDFTHASKRERVAIIRELTQQDGWKTHSGRMTKTKMSRESVHSQSYATIFRHCAGVTADLDPPGPYPLADLDPPSQIWTPPQNIPFS